MDSPAVDRDCKRNGSRCQTLYASLLAPNVVPVTPPTLCWRHCKRWRLTDVSDVFAVSFLSKLSGCALINVDTSECLQ
ncbi:hypothetical protein T265_08758 [Opisthorchis viverrini]|uniref:Uncharacterized protein n=1 Tax=Opisthorchis viverrini TaxID=6198 RepID=A0A074Z8B1_OPIVI|nr:hypothetical protein T265_08758 [Opisthorchis viverrini]KER23348.1 hypothetical protein T265_08758 [Opisthorchis viverrini]